MFHSWKTIKAKYNAPGCSLMACLLPTQYRDDCNQMCAIQLPVSRLEQVIDEGQPTTPSNSALPIHPEALEMGLTLD